MSLEIHVSSEAHATVLAFQGRAPAELLYPLRDAIAAAVTDAPLLVLDVAEASPLDTDALRSVLIDVLTTAPTGRVRVAAHPGQLRELVTAGLAAVVPVHPSRRSAVAAANEAGAWEAS